jgi:hypothetical protein
MKKLSVAASLAYGLLFLYACGSGGSSTTTTTPLMATQLSVSSSTNAVTAVARHGFARHHKRGAMHLFCYFRVFPNQPRLPHELPRFVRNVREASHSIP